MAIFNEAYTFRFTKILESGLTDSKIEKISKILDKEYSNIMSKTKNYIKNMQEFKNFIEYYTGRRYAFYFDPYFNAFRKDICIIHNYHEIYISKNKNIDPTDNIELVEKFKSDINKLKNLLKNKFSDYDFKVICPNDDENIDSHINDYKKTLKAKKHDIDDSSYVIVCIMINNKKYKKYLTDPDVSIDSKDKNMYISLYDKFAKFLNNPNNRMGAGFWSGHLADICKIIGMTDSELNSIISKNINTSKATTIVKICGKDAEEINEIKYVSDYVGDCCFLDDYDEYLIVYSVNDKKVYLVNAEHTDVVPFVYNFPTHSKELKSVFDNNKLKSLVNQIFKDRDTEKGYNFIKK